MKWLDNNKIIAWGFFFALGILAALNISSYWHMHRFMENNKLVAQSLEVHHKLEDLLLALTDAETGQRGYIISRDAYFLEQYQAALRLIPKTIKEARELTAPHLRVQQRLDSLEPLIAKKLALLKKRIALIEKGEYEAAAQSVKQKEGLRLLEESRNLVDQIEQEEGILIEQRLKEARASRDKFVFTLVTVSLTGYGLLGLIFYLLKRDISQRRRAEEALRQRELEFRMMVNNIPAVVFKGYLDGAVDFFDHKVEAMTGYGKADFDARRVKWTELMLKEDLRNAAKIFIRALRTDGAYVREYRLKSKEGRVIWIQERSQIVVKPGGEVEYLSGVFFDISEPKRAEAALKESEERFRVLFESSPDVVGQVDLDLNFIVVNQMAQSFLGYERAAELIGQSFLDLVDPSDHPRVLADARKLLEAGVIRNIEYTFLKKDGTPFPGELSASVNLDLAGNPQAFTGAIRDITARRRAEEALKESLEKLHRALDGTVSALAATIETRDPYTAGHQRRVAQLACALARELGFSEDQLQGIQVSGFLHDIGKIAVPAEILNKPGKISEHEFSMIKTHPQVGYEVLKGIEFPWPVALTILQHHERLNGSGYPHGLSQEDILLEARILAVADVMEAMVSHRPYRPALLVNQALEEISQHRGILYDPEVVEVCLQLFTEKGFEFQ